MAQTDSRGIKKFIGIALAIQIAMLGLVGLAALGFDVPILRQIVGFIYLAFIPGLLILRILKLHRLGSIETLLYSVGLSIAFVMFLGFLINLFYPLIGISKPISTLPVLVTITFVVFILCIVAYIRDSPESDSRSQDSPTQWPELLSPPALFLLLLPILAVLGAHLVYLHQGNTVLLILLSLIALTVILIAFNKFIPVKLYPLAVIAIGIALVWHWSLVSPGFFGYDIHHEYIAQSLVLSNSVWEYDAVGNINAMLSIVMLAPIYSLILNLDTVWLFKIIYPLFFSLVPLALFQAYRKQTGDKVAFFAAFFFMSMPVFFSEALTMCRQQIAELFLALSILLLLDKKMNATKRAALLIIFGLSIVVSHYGLSYIYMLYLLMALLLLLLWRSSAIKDLWGRIVTRFSKVRHRVSIVYQSSKLTSECLPQSTLTGVFVTLFIVFGFAWYMYVSAGLAFSSIVRIGDHIYNSMSTEFFLLETRDPHVTQALGLTAMRASEIEWEIARVIQYVAQFFIVVGILRLIVSWRKTRFHPEYTAMSLASIVILAMCVILPYFADSLNMTRIYHIALFFLAPFCILGGIAVFQWLSRIPGVHWLRNDHTSLKLVVISVVVPYFLFTTGFIFQLTGAAPGSMALALYEADWRICTDSDAQACQWVGNHLEDDAKIYVDGNGGAMLRYGGMRGVSKKASFLLPGFLDEPEQIAPDSYIFLRRWNLVHGEAQFVKIEYAQVITRHVNLESIISSDSLVNKIYDNGQARVLKAIR